MIIAPRHRISQMVANKDYSFFDEIKKYTESADYSIVNFECPVVEGEVKPIVYGLGNFCFDWEGEENSFWNEGYMVLLEFDKTIQIELIPYKQCNTEPKVKLLTTEESSKFNISINKLNLIISDDKQLAEAFADWCNKRYNSVNSLFRSYHNRYLNAAAIRGWIKHPQRPNEIKAMLNYIMCESHRDITIKILMDSITKS